MSKLKDYCIITPGYAFKSDTFSFRNDFSSKVIKITDITPPFTDVNNCLSVDIASIEKRKLQKFIVDDNDYVMAMTGATIGKVGRVINTLDRNVYINQRVCKFEPLENCDKEYLYFLLNTDWFKNMILANVDSTSAQPNIGHSTIYSFEYNFPSKKEQQKIASILSSLDKKIEINNKIIKELEAMSKELYDYWFVQFDFPDTNGKPYRTSGGAMTYNQTLKREIPLGWEVKQVEEITDCLFGYPFSTELFNENENGVPVVRIRDIVDNTTSTYTEESVDSKYILEDGDVLIGMDGNFHINLWSNGVALLNQRCCRIRCDVKKNLSAFTIIHQIKPHIELRERTVSRTTVGHLSNNDIRNINIVVPNDCNLSQMFVDIEVKIIKAKKEARNLSNLRDWLLPMLMNGQVTI